MSIVSTISGFFLNSSVPELNSKSPIVGYKGTDVPEEYIVVINSARSSPTGNGISVRAILQDEVNMRVGSKWESFLDIARGNSLLDAVEYGAQAISGRSLQNAVLSRRIWRGTDPISLTLNLRFEEEYNSKIEVMEACEALQSMCLPGGGDKQLLGLLIPPGPSPFVNDLVDLKGNSELISVSIGRALYFANVIVKDVSVSFQVRMGTDGFFKAAKVSVLFETYEIVTKNRLRSSSANDGGIYSPIGLTNKQRYASDYETLQKAAGFKPDVNSNVLGEATTKIKDFAKSVTGGIL